MFPAFFHTDHQGVVVEEIAPAYDTQVGEERAEAVQARDAKQQQVVGDDGQHGETQGAKGVRLDVVVLVADEEDPQFTDNISTSDVKLEWF
ncbi:hypothetical protein EYF80_026538 [Liparis tanakae]|uniref:Uncharacterized protein n=1 Tax=Liparis tanakae TaxID=230148 RepID=A0A4Z2HBM1_9TELE|nr:hypothetical protein EYF80_026538 [Liparis tanakae]